VGSNPTPSAKYQHKYLFLLNNLFYFGIAHNPTHKCQKTRSSARSSLGSARHAAKGAKAYRIVG
jgi:hypothetical protein